MIFNLMDLTPEVNAIAFGWLDDTYEFDSLTFESGGKFHNNKPEVILGSLLAKNLNKKVGDTLNMQGSTFTVVGHLPRRHGAGGRRGDFAPRSNAAAYQHAGKGLGVSRPAAPCAVGRVGRTLFEARTG